MENDNLVYSTKKSFKNHTEEARLEVINKKFRLAMLTEAHTAFQEANDKLIDGSSDSLPHLHIRDFIECWEDNLKALIREGRDLIAEKTPERSIFTLWVSQTGSHRQGFVLVDDHVDDNGVHCYKQLYYTPSISPIQDCHQEVIDLNLEIIFGELDLLKNNKHTDKFNALNMDLCNKLNSIYEKKQHEPDPKIKIFREAWEKLFTFLDNYKLSKDSGNKEIIISNDVTKKPNENILHSDDDLFEW